MNPAEQKKAAKAFVERWKSLPCVEEEHSRSFWIELLEHVLGIPAATRVLEFERKVKGRKIDVFYEDMGILIEQKGRGISLDESTVRSKKAGPETPFQQAKWYADNLPYSVRPRWIVTCNFDELRIYDLDKEDYESFISLSLEELPSHTHLLGFVGPETFCSNLVKLIPDAGLYHFGVLHSQMHNAWMRTVCGRLKSDYRYSGGVVYNNFPWPQAAPDTLDVPVEELVPAEARQRIEACAQAVLDAREQHPGRTIASLYDPKKMPADLLAAHKALNAAVEAAYGVSFDGDEERIVAHLFKLYAKLEGDN